MNVNRTALLVEDSAEDASIASLFLTRNGYRVHLVRDGRPALEALEVDPLPGVVVLDALLPHVTGFEVLRSVRSRARTRDVPIVLMSGGLRPSEALPFAFELGANDFIWKPYREFDFIARVTRAADG